MDTTANQENANGAVERKPENLAKLQEMNTPAYAVKSLSRSKHEKPTGEAIGTQERTGLRQMNSALWEGPTYGWTR